MVIGKFGQRGDYRCQINLDTQTLIKKEATIEEPKLTNSVSVSEQEVCINFMRDENFATIYTF